MKDCINSTAQPITKVLIEVPYYSPLDRKRVQSWLALFLNLSINILTKHNFKNFKIFILQNYTAVE